MADPPYGIGYHSNHHKGRNPHAPIANDWNFQIGRFLSEVARVLCDGGALYLFCRWDVSPLWLPHVPGTGLKAKTKIVWVKDNWTAGDLEGSFGNQYEEILFITKGRHKLRGKRWPNVWNFGRVPSAKLLHPAQKPVPLLDRIICSSSDPGQLVIDPFSGSGSTGEAAKKAGRAFILGDIDRRMVLLSCKRLGIPCTIDIGDEDDHPAPVIDFEFPNPEEWGIHPEELSAILDHIRGNNRAFQAQPGLFTGAGL